jgi:hypothetical protein
MMAKTKGGTNTAMMERSLQEGLQESLQEGLQEAL